MKIKQIKRKIIYIYIKYLFFTFNMFDCIKNKI